VVDVRGVKRSRWEYRFMESDKRLTAVPVRRPRPHCQPV